MEYVRVQSFNDAGLRTFQRAYDAYLLVNRYVNLLLGYPAVLMLENVKRGLGVASGGSIVQGLGGVELAVSAALQFGHFHQRVELLQSAKLRRGQASAHGEAVALQPIACGFVDRF